MLHVRGQFHEQHVPAEIAASVGWIKANQMRFNNRYLVLYIHWVLLINMAQNGADVAMDFHGTGKFFQIHVKKLQ